MAFNNSTIDCNDTKIYNYRSVYRQWGLAAIASIVMISTLAFNFTVIAKLKTSSVKSFTKCFLVSLAIADILLGVTVIPFAILGFFYDNRNIFGTLTCEIFNSCDVMFTTTSIFHLSTLAFDRFVALRCPLNAGRICNRKTLIILLLICWTIPAALSFGLIMPGLHVQGVEQIEFTKETKQCSCVFIINIYYATLPAIVCIFIPTLFITFFNFSICLYLRKRRNLRNISTMNQVRPNCTGNNKRLSIAITSIDKETHVAVTICSMTIAFIFCWVPFFVFNIVSAAMFYQVPDILPVFIWFGYASSAINPIVFLILEFRQH